MSETERITRPRGGQVWRHAVSGEEVLIEMRRRVWPMASVRPHSDLVWSLIAFTSPDRVRAGVAHESDFCRQHTFVRGRQ